MNCPNCSAPISENSVFCPNCGANIHPAQQSWENNDYSQQQPYYDPYQQTPAPNAAYNDPYGGQYAAPQPEVPQYVPQQPSPLQNYASSAEETGSAKAFSIIGLILCLCNLNIIAIILAAVGNSKASGVLAADPLNPFGIEAKKIAKAALIFIIIKFVLILLFSIGLVIFMSIAGLTFSGVLSELERGDFMMITALLA